MGRELDSTIFYVFRVQVFGGVVLRISGESFAASGRGYVTVVGRARFNEHRWLST